jgi:PPOX class probable F420-dependent enzyme
MVGQLAGERYISLTTFRRDGSAASTPVWVVSDDGERLLVWTGANTWKVKRIRHDPRVLVAAATMRGREFGPRLEAHARVLGPEAGELVAPLLRRKYGWQRRGLELQAAFRRLLRRPAGPGPAYLEIR